ncbi:MAG: hypothetical protein M3Y28_10830, partial [Armatimonadota bacterium]|nr:hypothetical protein [Armatimonadota bacterium]
LMNRQNIFVVVSLLLLVLPSLARGQAGVTKIGPVTISAKGGGELSGNQLLLRGGVQMTSPDYDLNADHIAITFQQPGKKGSSPAKKGSGQAIAGATAEGNPAKGTQVTGRFTQVALARTYNLKGDHAVYTPDASRPSGGQIDFTGHVLVTLIAPNALDGPFTMNTDHATVYLGKGVKYPSVEFGPATATFTPLQ